MIAMVIFAMVIAAVDVSLSIITERTTGATETAQAVDQLQVAEQTVVQAVHAADSWCTPVPSPAYGCAAFTSPPTATSLDFTAKLDGTTATYVFTLSAVDHVLTESKDGGTPVTLLTNVDPSSGFTVVSHTEANGTTYYTAIGIDLTVDSPSVTAPRPVRTTAADSSVEAWNVEFACSAWVESQSPEGEAC